MAIDTTIYINKKLSARLDRCSCVHGISRSKIACLLIDRFVKEKKPPCSLFRSVKYQARDSQHEWETRHIYFSNQMYEQSSDIRKFFKLSVSLLISLAIRLYLDELEKKLKGEGKNRNITDNYLNAYFCVYNNDNYTHDFHIYWGILDTKDIEKNLKRGTLCDRFD
jgi:hypothetical protein